MTKKTDYHIQCILKKNNTIQISWIPEKYAKVGKYLELKEGDEWQNGWRVEKLYNRALSEIIIKHENSYKKMKEVTDI